MVLPELVLELVLRVLVRSHEFWIHILGIRKREPLILTAVCIRPMHFEF